MATGADILVLSTCEIEYAQKRKSQYLLLLVHLV